MSDLRVLVVEDEEVAGEAHRAHVESTAGFTCIAVAGTGRAAWDALARHEVDLVLLDMNLPDGHGLDFLHQLRAAGFHGGVLALTAATDLPVVRRAVAYGVTQYLVKPFGFD